MEVCALESGIDVRDRPHSCVTYIAVGKHGEVVTFDIEEREEKVYPKGLLAMIQQDVGRTYTSNHPCR